MFIFLPIYQDAFTSCVEFYGDTARSQQPNTFFSLLINFANNFQQCLTDNADRAMAEQVLISLFALLNFLLFSDRRLLAKEIIPC